LAKLIKEGNELPRPRQQIVFIDPEPTPSKHLILGEQVKAAQDAQRRGAEIQNWNFASKISAEQHQRLIRDFAHSAQRIEVNADRMSRRELAIAKFAIAKATAEEGKVQRILSAPTAGPKTVNLGPLEDAVGYLGKMNARAANGLPSIDYRMVNVSVRKKDGKFISGLRVYALPKDMLNEPGNYSQALIKNLLEDLTFEKLTSPSLDKIPISELQIWVGPEFSYEEMRKMVVEKKLKKYKPVHASFTSTTLELVFEAPDEVQGKGGDNE
jgi:hypothetical protein